MSGFDTSQPVTDRAALRGTNTDAGNHEPQPGDADTAALAEDLGDATPGPR